MGNIAVIGCGYWGRNLVRNFAQMGALGAVCDPVPATAESLSREHAVRALSLEAVLADPSIEGVAIAAPAELHADLAVRALAAGKHVFVEKPIALSEADAQAMAKASEAAGRTLMVGHLLQYHPAFEALLSLVRAGEIGQLRYAYSNRLSLGKFRVEEDVLWSFAPHDLSMLLALFDAEPDQVARTGGSYVTSGIDDFVRVDLSFSGGGRAHVFASWLHPFKEHRLVAIGETGMVVFEDSAQGAQKLRLYRHQIDASGREPVASKAEPELWPFAADEPLRRELTHFTDCVAGRVTPRTGPDEAMRVLRVLIRASAT